MFFVNTQIKNYRFNVIWKNKLQVLQVLVTYGLIPNVGCTELQQDRTSQNKRHHICTIIK